MRPKFQVILCLLLCLFVALLDVFPVPRLVKVRSKTEALCITDQPTIRRRVDLDRTVRIVCIHRAAADVNVQRATSEVWTIDCESSSARIRRLSSQLLLILGRTERGNDLEVFV